VLRSSLVCGLSPGSRARGRPIRGYKQHYNMDSIVRGLANDECRGQGTLGTLNLACNGYVVLRWQDWNWRVTEA
jgi:hypothetical protein